MHQLTPLLAKLRADEIRRFARNQTERGQVVAGVGVSGGTTEQDVAIVEAAMR
jgi:hypothetical protein